MSRDLVVIDTNCCLMTSSSSHFRHILLVVQSHKSNQLVQRLKCKWVNARAISTIYWQAANKRSNLPWDMISSPTPLKSSPAQNLSSPTPICSIFLARTVWTDLPAQQTTKKRPSLAVWMLKSTIWLSWMKSHEMRSASSQWPEEKRKTRRSVPGSWTGHRRLRRAGRRSSPGDPEQKMSLDRVWVQWCYGTEIYLESRCWLA